MHYFEKRVVSVTENARVELHDRSSPEIVQSVLLLVLIDLFEDVLKESTLTFRTLSCFRRVLGQILEYGPEVEQSSPVDVA